jgi:hypothetical protein
MPKNKKGGSYVTRASKDQSFLLHCIDIDLAKEQQLAGCPYCGGPLHHSSYQRKPRGGPDSIPDEYLVRLSLCCGREDCRRRTLPPSSLFMGRRMCWRCVILVILTLRQNRPNGTSTGRLTRLFRVSRNTIKRWIAYYRDIFPSSDQWQRLRGRISSSVRDNELPGGLVRYFLDHSESPEKALAGCPRFLATGGSICHTPLNLIPA